MKNKTSKVIVKNIIQYIFFPLGKGQNKSSEVGNQPLSY